MRWYGGFLPVSVSYMPHAVKGFFDNGGRRAFIARIVHDAATPATATLDELRLRAIGLGGWGSRLRVLLRPGTKTSGTQLFRVTLAYWRELRDPSVTPRRATSWSRASASGRPTRWRTSTTSQS
jgi:uncharacterized protein